MTALVMTAWCYQDLLVLWKRSQNPVQEARCGQHWAVQKRGTFCAPF